MTNEQRKQLEEMAVIAQLSYGQSAGGQRVGARVRSYGVGYRDGAQAAWDMATKAGVNEGIDAVLRLAPYWKNVSTPQIVDDILELRRSINPAPRIDGTEERES